MAAGGRAADLQTGAVRTTVTLNLQSSVAAGRRQSSVSGSKSHRTTLYCLRPTPPATGKRQMAMDLQSTADF